MTELLVKDLLPDLERADNVAQKVEAVRSAPPVVENTYRQLSGQGLMAGTFAPIFPPHMQQLQQLSEQMRLQQQQLQQQRQQLGGGAVLDSGWFNGILGR